MTNYLGEESDLDEFLQLEQQIINENPAELRKFAMMFKTKSPEILAKADNIADAFSNLDLGSFVGEFDEPIQKETKQVPVKPRNLQKENVKQQQQQNEESSLNDDDNQPLSFQPLIPEKMTLKQKYLPETIKQDKFVRQEEMIQPPIKREEPKKDIRETKPKYNQDDEEPTIVKMPKQVADILKPRLKQQQEQQNLKQQEFQNLQIANQNNVQEKQFDQQLVQLETEINKYKLMQSELDKQKKNLEYDYRDLLQQLEKDKAEFKAYQKQQHEDIKQQKQIIDDARKARQSKQQETKKLEEENTQLKEELKNVQAQLKSLQMSSKKTTDALRKNLEEEIKTNAELKEKLTSADQTGVQMRKAEIQSKTQINMLNQQVAQMQQEIDALRMQLQLQEVHNAEQQLKAQQQLQQQQQPLFVKTEEPRTLFKAKSEGPLKFQVEEKKTPVSETKSETRRTIQQQSQQNASNAQQTITNAKYNPNTQNTAAASAPNNQILFKADKDKQFNVVPKPQNNKLQLEFKELPFFTPEQLVEQFNRDLNEFVTDAEITEEKQKSDRTEQKLSSGARLIRFENGTTKLVLNEQVTDIRFENGDLKRISGQTTVYFYQSQGTLFTQLPANSGNVKVYRFANEQVEKHFEDGRKVVYYPDGTVKYVYADGSEKAVFPDGEVVNEKK
ncbi:T-complex_protein-10 [Hexamita inflata]|uniref:T-complex protein-10 n=1 Tax=Hexamita inflata TaxID=28002 RepID=A0AA86TPS4_9EUKA|nr:T-complex protein-10 [Hexamita inflata]